MSRNCVISIGIDGYYNLKPLKYAQNDAAAMRQFCLKEAKFETAYFFGEGAEPIQQDYGSPLLAEPTFGNIDRFLDVRFREPFLEAGDNLWFFFAGHGRRQNQRDYLMPIDGNPSRVERTCLEIADIAGRLRRCGADNIILMIDACRGEDDREGGEGIGIEEHQGVIMLYSCSPNELSYEIDELKQGAFTHSLLQGLRIQGTGNCATVERLNQHLRYQVPELNQRYNKRRQTPYVTAEPATKLHLILLPGQATLQDVMALKNDALEAEAEAQWEAAEQLWVRVLVVSPGDWQAVRALQRIALRRHPQSTAASAAIDQVKEGARSIYESVSGPVTKPAPETETELSQPTFKFEFVTVDSNGTIKKREQRRAEYHRETLGASVDLDLVLIPTGRFHMGSPLDKGDTDEKPQHEVMINSFWMGKYPITQAQWKSVANYPRIEIELEAEPSHFQGNNRPVEQVSWNAATEFCRRLSARTGLDYRLPSEAEWEYACKAGKKAAFSYGETLTSDLANYNANYTYSTESKGKYRQETTDVGIFPANSFGLYDMHGNVLEWCQDNWHETYKGAPTDGSAWLSFDENTERILKGGSWSYQPADCRSSNRGRFAPFYWYDIIGFRVACTIL